MVWAVVCLALVAACLLLWQQNRAMRRSLNPWEGRPAVTAFWDGFLRYHQKTDVVLPDDSVSVVEDITQRPISLGDYLSRNYMRQIQASNISADRKVDLDQIANHNLVTFGGVRAAQQMLALIPVSYPAGTYAVALLCGGLDQERQRDSAGREEGESVGASVR